MRIEKTYVADDGTKFDNEIDCRNYEKELKEKAENEILQEIKDLSLVIWKKYHPNYKENNEPTLYQAPLWLRQDIAAIMTEFPDSENDIISIIKTAKHGDEIIRDYLELDSIKRKVAIKTDFLSALRSVKCGSDLSGEIDWGLSDKDLAELAKLHKANKCRRKIEELLTDCNFHYECGKFVDKQYEEFIK